jgi:outer membrane lipoprotein-sorting protein
MKKVVLLFAAAIMAASLVLTGCGGSKDAAKAPPPAKEESVADLFAKGKNVPGMSYDYVMTAKEMKMEGKMWVAGKKVRTDMTAQNQKMSSIVDGDANVAYTYMPDQKTAMKITLDKAKTEKTPDSFTQPTDAPKYKVVETTTYEGVKCKVLLMQDADKKIDTKIWVREDCGLPMRVEVAEGSDKMVMEYKNMKVGPVPPETFKLPDGTNIVDMGDMMKNLPKKP